MATSKIKKGDTVRVIAGRSRDKEGKVTSVDVKNHKVVVEGVNLVTKHMKPSAANPDGGISLLARRIQFIHPVKKTEVDVTAPVPENWKGIKG